MHVARRHSQSSNCNLRHGDECRCMCTIACVSRKCHRRDIESRITRRPLRTVDVKARKKHGLTANDVLGEKDAEFEGDDDVWSEKMTEAEERLKRYEVR